MIPASTQARFWRKVDQSAGAEECWPWTGDRDPKGYGKIRVSWRRWFAHRVSLVMATGHSPDSSIYALHRCDNPPCCNPAHLRWGTAKENTADRLARTHRPGMLANHGEKNGRAVLTAEQVREIRRAPSGGVKLAQRFGVSKPTITRIRAGKAWTHVAQFKEI